MVCSVRFVFIDENIPELSGIPDFFICQIYLFSGYGHRHISGSLNFISNIFRIIFVRPFSSMCFNPLCAKLDRILIYRQMLIYSLVFEGLVQDSETVPVSRI